MLRRPNQSILLLYLASAFQEVDSAIHRINLCPVDSVQLVSQTLIHWIEIYAMDSAVQLLNL